MPDASGLDGNSIQQIAGTLADFGIYGFAAVAVVGFFAVKTGMAKAMFGAVFVVGAVLSIVKMYLPPPVPPEPVKFVRGDFGLFESRALPKVLSLDKNFYVASREDGVYTGIDWVMLFDKSVLEAGHVAMSLYAPFEKKVVANDLTFKIEQAVKGGRFKVPLEPFSDPQRKQDDWVRLKIVSDQENENSLCLAGEPFKTPVCSERPQRNTSIDLPGQVPVHTMLGGLTLRFMASAMAQTIANTKPDASALRKALSSNDIQQLQDASKAIQQEPLAYKDVVTDVFARPIGSDSSSDRLAVITGLRERYRLERTVYPDSATFSWIDDSTWRRMVLDSFDRADLLGEMSRRFLRTAKSPRAKQVLDETIQEAQSKLPHLNVCLDLLVQDIYVNWAVLSLGSLKEAKSVTEDNARALANLLSEIQFPSDGSLSVAHRLRANYLKAVVLLEAAESLDSAAGKALRNEGIQAMKEMHQSVTRFGAQQVEKVYYGNTAELAKAAAFLKSLAETSAVKLDILAKAQGEARPYPSCKL